ncbi:hypothetical protein ACOSQ2_019389 [Xanthoceras sorbifolium]
MAATHSSSFVQEGEVNATDSSPLVFASMSKSLNFNLPVKLTKDNYISWKAQVLPAIRALELEVLISGAKPPPKLIAVQSSADSETEFTINKSYTAWMKADQLLLC